MQIFYTNSQAILVFLIKPIRLHVLKSHSLSIEMEPKWQKNLEIMTQEFKIYVLF